MHKTAMTMPKRLSQIAAGKDPGSTPGIPHDIEAEQALLGAILSEPSALGRVAAFLAAGHFFDPLHGRIYDALVAAISAGQPADPHSLAARFAADAPIDRETTAAQYVHALFSRRAAADEAGRLGRRLLDLADRRRMIALGENILADAYEGGTALQSQRAIEAPGPPFKGLLDRFSPIATPATSPAAGTHAAQTSTWRGRLVASLPLGVAVLALLAAVVALVLLNAQSRRNSERLHTISTRLSSTERELMYQRKWVGDVEYAHQATRGDAALRGARDVSKGQWTRLAGGGESGSWTPDKQLKTKALAVHNDLLCTGLLGDTPGDAEVWCLDKTWQRIGGRGLNGSWTGSHYVTHLTSFDGALYAGVDDEIWRFADGRWTRIGSVGKGRTAYCGTAHAGALYIGTSGGGADLFRIEGNTLVWVQNIEGERYSGIYELHGHEGQLYIGTIANFGTAAVFRYDGGAMTKIGGDGVNGSWLNPGFSYLESFTSLGGQLVVTMNRMPVIEQPVTAIWAFDGKEWRPVGRKSMPSLWRRLINFNASLDVEGTLVVSAGGIPAGDASLWALSPSGNFEQIGGHGVNGSWTRLASKGNAEYIYRLKLWRGQIVAGFGDAPGMAQIWAYRPSESGEAVATARSSPAASALAQAPDEGTAD